MVLSECGHYSGRRGEKGNDHCGYLTSRSVNVIYTKLVDSLSEVWASQRAIQLKGEKEESIYRSVSFDHFLPPPTACVAIPAAR